ncbi:flagellin, partial [Salinisphaera sp. C84B14]|uniref:flagellin N-terminal helical domain-containing protein n=1 Tax=Salinisphaera sp. C84B14 TaxID=1304155 RepID=UPI0033405B06
MSFVINTNTLSLTAQQNLNSSQKTLNSAIERLSSGSKINSAKDDAAGQAISNRMTSQINGLKQASSNANDGISLAQTTEGALNQINDNLQRVRELSVQAANGTNSQSDLESIQNEITQRLGEIDRVSEQTAFNGTKVLDGSKTEIKIQVGDKDDQTISINLENMDSASLGLEGFNVDGSVAYDEAGSTLGANDSVVSYTNEDGNTAYAVKTDDGTNPVTYAAAVIDADGAVTSGAAVAAADISNEATVADGDTVRSDAAKSANPLATLDSALKQ